MSISPAVFWENEKRQLLAVLLPFLSQAAQRGVQSAARKAGIALSLELANAAAAEWARRYTDELLAQLGTTSERLVGEALSEWIGQQGSTMGDLVELLKPRFADNAARADLIAVTEVTRAYANGEKSTYLANGITRWRWNTNRDELVCKYCGAVNGKVVQIGDLFGWFRGKKITEPPYHPGCRCWTSPVVGKRESQERGLWAGIG